MKDDKRADLHEFVDELMTAPPQSLELVHKMISQLIADGEDVEKNERVIWLLGEVAEKRGMVWRDGGLGMRLYRT